MVKVVLLLGVFVISCHFQHETRGTFTSLLSRSLAAISTSCLAGRELNSSDTQCAVLPVGADNSTHVAFRMCSNNCWDWQADVSL